MKAVVIRAGSAALEAVPSPEAQSECLIRITRAGICGTDLELLRGYGAFEGIPGHEFVGIVADAPAEARAWIGRRVVGEINVGCGACDWCAARVKEHCPHRTVVGILGRSGAFAEYLTLPVANLHAVPEHVHDDVAVFVEPVAAACRILEQIEVSGRTTAVIGDGRLGLLIAQVLCRAGARVRVFGRHAHKLRIAEQLGLAVNGGPERYDIAVDATGRAEGLRLASELVRPRGTIVMKSTYHGEGALKAWPLVVDEVQLVGSRCGPFAAALDLLATGAVEVRPLLAATYALEDFGAAYDRARRELKVLLRP